MSYRVEYGGKTPKVSNKREKTTIKFEFQLITAAFFLVFVLAARSFWPQGQAVLRQWFVPEPVMAELAANLAQGESLTDSLQELCREVFALAED